MVKKAKTKELLKRLDNLQAMMNRKSDAVVVATLDDWLESDEEGTFNDYINRKTSKMSNATILIDDMIIAIDIYLPTEFLYDIDDKTVMQKFVDATSNEDKKEYMKLYIQVFDEMFSDAEISCSEKSFYHDFIEHYKTMSIEKLVERYEDQRFFRMSWI